MTRSIPWYYKASPLLCLKLIQSWLLELELELNLYSKSLDGRFCILIAVHETSYYMKT